MAKKPPIKTEIDPEEAAIAVASSPDPLPPDESPFIDEPIQAEAIEDAVMGTVVDLASEVVADKKTAPGFAELVFVKLVGANTAVLNGKAVLRGEVHEVTYGAYLEVKSRHPQKFAVRYQDRAGFAVEE